MMGVAVRVLPFELQGEQAFRLNLHVLHGELRFGQNTSVEFPSLTAVFRFAYERADRWMMADLLADVAIRKIIAAGTKEPLLDHRVRRPDGNTYRLNS